MIFGVLEVVATKQFHTVVENISALHGQYNRMVKRLICSLVVTGGHVSDIQRDAGKELFSFHWLLKIAQMLKPVLIIESMWSTVVMVNKI